MLRRKAMDHLIQWREDGPGIALLVDGARQVGKTYLIREFGRQYYKHLVEINLLEVEGAARAFASATTSDELFLRISAYADEPIAPHETLIFIDEVQEAPEMITAAKFLVEKMGENFDFVFSGSLLGVELKKIKSWPVGYLRTLTMYPLDFDEWCWANGVADLIIDSARDAIASARQIDPFVHERLLGLFHHYLAVGGMPKVVQTFIDTKSIQDVRRVQGDITAAYRNDITKYCPERDVLFVKRVFDTIPAQLNSQSKRFVATSVGKDVRVERNENRFVWLEEAGVALPVYNVSEPRYPLALSQNENLFKLFMSDVGLLAHESGMDVVRSALEGKPVNYGAIYENYVAQELRAHGYAQWYYRSKKHGELDFLAEWPSGTVLPIEVKSGKDYRRHSALKAALGVAEWDLAQAVVLYDGNVSVEDAITYLPIYAAGWLDAFIGLR